MDVGEIAWLYLIWALMILKLELVSRSESMNETEIRVMTIYVLIIRGGWFLCRLGFFAIDE